MRASELPATIPRGSAAVQSCLATWNAAMSQRAIVGLRIPRRRCRVFLRDRDQHVRCRARVEHRIHRRLLQRDRSSHRLRIAPLLERVMIRKNQIAQLARVVRMLEKRTLNGTFAIAAAKPVVFGSVNAGFAPRTMSSETPPGIHPLGKRAQLRRRMPFVEAQIAFVRLDRRRRRSRATD